MCVRKFYPIFSLYAIKLQNLHFLWSKLKIMYSKIMGNCRISFIKNLHFELLALQTSIIRFPFISFRRYFNLGASRAREVVLSPFAASTCHIAIITEGRRDLKRASRIREA